MMHKGRLEAFSDGVIAIIITIMVLELKVPEGVHFKDLFALWPKFISYIMSFFYVGVYWNNHHHMFQATRSVSSGILWANMNLLFWLSILPFSTGWVGEHHFAQKPMLFYGFNLLMCAAAYQILMLVLISHHGKESILARAFGRDMKGKLSLLIYTFGIVGTFFNPWLGFTSYGIVVMMWIVPDPRMVKAVKVLKEQD